MKRFFLSARHLWKEMQFIVPTKGYFSFEKKVTKKITEQSKHIKRQYDQLEFLKH